MSKYAFPKYDWLPAELKLTGYNYEFYRKRLDVEKHGSRSATSHSMWLGNFEHDLKEAGAIRYYEGTGEILSLMDQAGWPPEKTEDFLVWDPENLDRKTRDLMNLHMGIIGAYLFGRLSAPLDLFNLYWRNVITDYVQELSQITENLNLPIDFSQPERISLVPNNIMFRCGSAEQIKKSDEIIASMSPDLRETSGEFIRAVVPTEVNYTSLNEMNKLRRDGASPELIFISKQSNHSFLRYAYNGDVDQLPDEAHGKSHQGISGTGLPLEIEAKINANLALQLRLKLWWGWPGAPFTCMENIIQKNLNYLVRQGALRHIGGNEFELPEKLDEKMRDEEKRDRKFTDLIQNLQKHLHPIKIAGVAASQIVGGVAKPFVDPYAASFASIITGLGRHILKMIS